MAFKHLTVAQAKELLANPATVIADIRDANTYSKGHIPQAVNLSNANIGQFMIEQEFEHPIIVVCYHGISSQGAANYLNEQGFEDVYSLDGGFEAWATSCADNIERS
ncbi:thiosulfate sulfurtransferase GlpE [Pseudoalteromonas tunicata]|jgi:thiosulfate sulfurtransferase|uniref:Thiosulfate sulfurtransferase GlpE n=1 Tax=Pseudoalteromonas tunicata D2 TaxID=87626 RepID=A4C7C5_9GAMM|nr:thiosulfate sulfurtransferase GlpE [Pseudoalteromonas tunicata]ATC95849.1 thiosulfate sulfurtransferase [Pseudoalteromonas tunicata]AXT31394.1 thiosulfate sulfurtransferase GlpE [Pseudoalteromonas tunicata]EAR29879.1 thiosulfate sulfurtransferase [Pseudoalteromonas tunicata D2]MDP4982188.1 thiosulfate sulfurtransferase GlpE [Pseudoalteromonas tunicata]MDP5214347.1 thiosulfate sulfurtransferase GlpE [Pseudoalteromonas tunicata]